MQVPPMSGTCPDDLQMGKFMAIPLGSVDWVAAMPRDLDHIFLKYPSTLRGYYMVYDSCALWVGIYFWDSLCPCFKSAVWPCEWMGGWG